MISILRQESFALIWRNTLARFNNKKYLWMPKMQQLNSIMSIYNNQKDDDEFDSKIIVN